jgi:hypothetical protein
VKADERFRVKHGMTDKSRPHTVILNLIGSVDILRKFPFPGRVSPGRGLGSWRSSLLCITPGAGAVILPPENGRESEGGRAPR